MGTYTLVFKSRIYKVKGNDIATIQQAYREWAEALNDGYESGTHQPLIYAVCQAGVPARSFGEAQAVAEELI